MSEQLFMNDIVENHGDRMGHIVRYYPFFRLWESGLNLYRDGQYAELDMGYLTMAVIRYFIEENSFNDRPVTYEMYADFMKTILVRDFMVQAAEDELMQLISCIFDKLCNEGRPFTVQWFDPSDRQKKTLRVRLIESRFYEGKIGYTLSADAIAFYLDTKEIKEESRITVEQVLLEKMVKSKNFPGGLQVISRINQEVSGLIAQKDEIMSVLSRNVFEGTKALKAFMARGLKWFTQEQKLFEKNKALVDSAMHMASADAAADELYAMDTELKRAMKKHSDLLAACTKLSVEADEMIARARKTRFRRRTDFVRLREMFLETDCLEGLAEMVMPLFGLNIRQSLGMDQLDGMLEYRPEEKLLTETVSGSKEKMYVYEDELAAQRISNNFGYLLKVLFEQLTEKGRTDLKELCRLYRMKFGDEIYYNGDLYAFLAHLGQKDGYDMQKIKESPDTFLEQMMADYVSGSGERFDHLKFLVCFGPGEIICPVETFEMTNMIFERN